MRSLGSKIKFKFVMDVIVGGDKMRGERVTMVCALSHLLQNIVHDFSSSFCFLTILVPRNSFFFQSPPSPLNCHPQSSALLTPSCFPGALNVQISTLCKGFSNLLCTSLAGGVFPYVVGSVLHFLLHFLWRFLGPSSVLCPHTQ